MFSEELTVALTAAKEAGALLRSSFHMQGNTVSYKQYNEPVSLVDYKSNDILIGRLLKAFPTHKILSEESEEDVLIDDDPTWILDPLDGTSNFIRDIPMFGLTIALVVEKVPVLGVIYDPIHEELFWATDSSGAFMNGHQIHTSGKEVTKGAMLLAGRGYRTRHRERHGRIIYTLEQETTYFRRYGCASIMLSSVACGRADSVILTGNKPWDTVAGVVLIKEAGGTVTDYLGQEWSLQSEDLLATNAHLHEAMIEITSRVN